MADAHAAVHLHVQRHFPWLKAPGQRHFAQHRQPAGNKFAVRVQLQRLFDRVVNAQGIAAGAARLHLRLRPVDARFVIDKQARQVLAGKLPGQPQIIAGKAHQHGAHAKIQPAGGAQHGHAGVHQRITGVAIAPGGQPLRVGVGAQRVHRRQWGVMFQLGALFEFLNKVAMPGQPRFKGVQAMRQALGVRVKGVQSCQARAGGLGDFAQRQRAPGQMRRQPRTGVHRSQRAGQAVAIARGALIQKPRQQRQAQAAPAALATAGAGVEQSPARRRVRQRRNVGGDDALGQRGWRGADKGLAPAGPVAAFAAAKHRHLRVFMPGDVVRAAPLRHGAVAGVAERIAGFLMAVDGRQRQGLAQRLQHVHHLAAQAQQRQAQLGQRLAQRSQGFFDKAPLPGRGVVALPERGLGDIQRQHRPGATGGGQGGVVHSAQIALEPDKMNRVSGIHERDSNAEKPATASLAQYRSARMQQSACRQALAPIAGQRQRIAQLVRQPQSQAGRRQSARTGLGP